MEHVNGWCFRGIYKGGLWENDIHVSASIIETTDTNTVGLWSIRSLVSSHLYCTKVSIFHTFFVY